MTTLTHQERAERAAKAVHEDLHYLGAKDAHADIIAREMYPRELVSLLRGVIAECVFCDNGVLVPMWDRPHKRAADGSCKKCQYLRAVLDLYPEPEEETDHER